MSDKGNTYEGYYELEDGCIIFIDNRTKTRFYKCRIKLDTKGYVFRSTKTTIKSKAILRAYEFYKDIRKREMLDLPIRDFTVKELFDKFLNDKIETTSEHSQKAYKRYLRLYFDKYFEDRLAVEITQAELGGYYNWRRSYWKHNKAREMNDQHRHVAKEPADSTIFNEVVGFNAVMLHAYSTGRIAKRIRIPTDESLQAGMYKRPSQATFTDDEMRKLSYHLRNSYLRSVPKMISPRTQRGAVNLYCAFFMLAATGLRTAELSGLRRRTV